MTITIKDPAIERNLLDLAATKGGDIEAALSELLAGEKRRAEMLNQALFEKARETDLAAYRESVVTTGRLSMEEALERMKALPFPKGVVLDDSRASYYEDENGRLPGMDGYGKEE